MKERLCYVKCKLNGIYAWGQGYVSNEMYQKWNEFWNNFEAKKSIYWRLVKNDKPYSGCDNLISTSSNIYLHPMDFKFVAMSSGVCSISMVNGVEKKEYFSEVVELEKIIKELCEYCGATYEFIRKEKEVDFE